MENTLYAVAGLVLAVLGTSMLYDIACYVRHHSHLENVIEQDDRDL